MHSSSTIFATFCVILLLSPHLILGDKDYFKEEKIIEKVKLLCASDPEEWKAQAKIWSCVEESEAFAHLLPIQQECVKKSDLDGKTMLERIEHICEDVDAGIETLKNVIRCEVDKREEDGVELRTEELVAQMDACKEESAE